MITIVGNQKSIKRKSEKIKEIKIKEHEWAAERNIKEEILEIPRNIWKWNHNDPKSMDHCKSSSKREVIVIGAYFRK